MHRLNTFAAMAITSIALQAAAHPGAHADHSAEEPAKANLLRTTEATLARHLADEGETPSLLAKLADIRLTLARQSGSHVDYRVAHSTFSRLLASSPGSAAAHLGRGYARLGLHEFGGALSDARAARFLDEDSPETLALLADAHIALGNYTEASLAADRLLDDSITLESLSRVGLIAYERSQYDTARTMFTDAIEAGWLLDASSSSIAWCSIMLGDAEAETGSLALAERAYLEAIGIDADAHHASAKLATLLAHKGEIEEAEWIMIRVANRFPIAQHRLTLASICRLHGEPHDLEYAAELEADVTAEMSAMLERNDLAHTRTLVEFWLSRSINTDRAVNLALTELRTVRRDVGAYETAAWALYKNDKHQEAARQAEDALRLAPNSPRLLLRAGVILEAAGKPAAAERLIRAGLASGAPVDPVLVALSRSTLKKTNESSPASTSAP